MEIGKEIKSTKFETNLHKSVVNIIYTYGWLTNMLKKRLSKHGITMQQYNVLRILRGQHPKPSTINLVRERMLDKMSDASRIVERLVQKDLVSRCVNDQDKRAVDILINESGLELLKNLDENILMQDILQDNISEKEAETLSNLLDKIRG